MLGGRSIRKRPVIQGARYEGLKKSSHSEVEGGESLMAVAEV